MLSTLGSLSLLHGSGSPPFHGSLSGQIKVESRREEGSKRSHECGTKHLISSHRRERGEESTLFMRSAT